MNKAGVSQLVIIGGGFAGLTAARALGHAQAKELAITLIDRSNHHLFQPLLYQVATAGLSPANIAMPIRSVLRRQSNVEVAMAEVTGIDPIARLVLTKAHRFHYDYLIIATGAGSTFFGHDEWSKCTQGLKTIEDATSIRRKILLAFEAAEVEEDSVRRQCLLTFVLVGGGPTGVEMAGSIAELAHQALKSDFRRIDPAMTRIVLIEAGPRILATFPDTMAAKAAHKLQALGVEILTQTRVEEITAAGVTFAGTQIPAKTVIWSAGVAASPAGKWLSAGAGSGPGVQMDRAGRVKVNADLTVPGHPEIYVIRENT